MVLFVCSSCINESFDIMIFEVIFDVFKLTGKKCVNLFYLFLIIRHDLFILSTHNY